MIYDNGSADSPKSGSFWCHYAIPTPVQTGIRVKEVCVNYASTDISQVSVDLIHAWDGNRRIFADDTPLRSADDYNGGIPGFTLDSRVQPDGSRIWKGSLGSPGIQVYFGVGVSLHVRAHQAQGHYLEIRGVGVKFEVPA